jgi:hypothetical protein
MTTRNQLQMCTRVELGDVSSDGEYAGAHLGPAVRVLLPGKEQTTMTRSDLASAMNGLNVSRFKSFRFRIVHLCPAFAMKHCWRTRQAQLFKNTDET